MKFKVLISNLESCVEDHCKKVFGDDTITVALVCRLDVEELRVGERVHPVVRSSHLLHRTPLAVGHLPTRDMTSKN